MCQFFEKRGYPVSVVQAGQHRAQLIDRQSSLQKKKSLKVNSLKTYKDIHDFKAGQRIWTEMNRPYKVQKTLDF